MDEKNILSVCVICITVALCTLVGSYSVKDYYSERNVVEAMKTGASAQEARCAIYGATSPVCSVLASQRTK